MPNVVFPSLLSDFAWPWLLLAIPIPWLLRTFLPEKENADTAIKVPYGREQLMAIAAQKKNFSGSAMHWIVWIAWIALCIAAARPQQLGVVVQLPQTGRNMMLAVDLSESMKEQDMVLDGHVVGRLTAAKAVLADFLDRRAGDRVGLIVFGRQAYALTPMTRDLSSVRQQLDTSVVGLAGRETALGDAIGIGVKRLRVQSKQQDAQSENVLILLTDGVNTAGQLDPIKAAELARDNDVRVYTIAFGGDVKMVSILGIPVQLPISSDGINEEILEEISELTGGKSFRARNTEELVKIYNEINQLEQVQYEGHPVRPMIERYPWPLGLSLGFMLLFVCLQRKYA